MSTWRIGLRKDFLTSIRGFSKNQAVGRDQSPGSPTYFKGGFKMNPKLTTQDVAMAPQEVAEVLGVKVQFVMRLLRAGKLKGGKMGKFWRV